MAKSIEEFTNSNSNKPLSKMPPRQQIETLLTRHSAKIQEALPNDVNLQRILRISQSAISATPKLQECFIPSVIGSIMECASIGLEPNNVLGQCYLVPFWNSKKSRSDCQVIIGYKGYLELARRSGAVEYVYAQAVFENDQFDYEYGVNQSLVHKPALTNQGQCIAFYSIIKIKDAGHSFEVRSRQYIESVRDAVAAKNRGNVPKPWRDNFIEMGRKTMIHRLSSQMPMSIEMAGAAALDGQTERAEEHDNYGDIFEGDFSNERIGEALPKNQPAQQPLAKEKTEEEVDFERGSEYVVTSMDSVGEIFDRDGLEETPLTDSAGEIFDPKIHSVNPQSGKPKMNADNTFRKIRVYRKKLAQEEETTEEATDPPEPETESGEEEPKNSFESGSNEGTDSVYEEYQKINASYDGVPVAFNDPPA